MESQEIVTGYKATDENMCCRGFQFELNKWYECKGELVLCENGFHFCEHPSGPWAYYSSGRIFKVEAQGVVKSTGPGADLKHVARKIRLVEEIQITGNRNTGDWNTGDGNCGDYHSGSLCHGPTLFYLFNIPTSREDVDFYIVRELSCLGENKSTPCGPQSREEAKMIHYIWIFLAFFVLVMR